MLTLLFYEAADDGPRTTLAEIEDALADLPGVELNGGQRAAYRPGSWRDAATGATCTIDLGTPPIEEDHLHPPTAYDGWREVGLALHLPIAGPHWLCVEALQAIELLLARLPRLRALDTEDVHDERGANGPATWSRPRILASWERLHGAHNEGRTDCWRMNRLASVCLWRYRRERTRAQRDFPELLWPESFALLDTSDQRPHSAAFWRDPGMAWALPPVELIIVARHDGAGVLPAAEVLTAGGGRPLPLAQAAALTPCPALAALFAKAELQPAARYRALGDHDWSD